jgi:hypothetical protein
MCISDSQNKDVNKAQFRNRLVHEPGHPDNESPSGHLTVPALQEYLSVVSKILEYIAYESPRSSE